MYFWSGHNFCILRILTYLTPKASRPSRIIDQVSPMYLDQFSMFFFYFCLVQSSLLDYTILFSAWPISYSLFYFIHTYPVYWNPTWIHKSNNLDGLEGREINQMFTINICLPKTVGIHIKQSANTYFWSNSYSNLRPNFLFANSFN